MKNSNTFDYKGIGHIHFTMTLPANEKVPSLWKCLIAHMLRTLRYVLHHPVVFPQESELLFVTQSLNNYRSLQPITIHLTKDNWRLISVYDFPTSLIYRKAIKSLPELMRFYLTCNTDERYRIRRVFNYFALAPGWCRVFTDYFKNCKALRTIIVANDHTMPTRCMIVSARELGIPVVYTQHASVTEKFPPLIFSYSFLDGMDSYNKYKALGRVAGKVILLGSPRFDEVIIKQRMFDGLIRESVGIGLNSMDSIDKALELCLYIKQRTGHKVIVRPHPRSMATIDQSVFTRNGVDISDSRVESSYVFFTHISVLVANESGIHLDAAIFGIPTLLYNFSNNAVLDWYGYIRNGLTTLADTQERVVDLINKIQPAPDEKVQYYYAAFRTQFDGKIAETMASFIDSSWSEVEADAFLKSSFEEVEPNLYIIKRQTLNAN